jgi:glutamate-1-semialdehyde 2,1-aminomutase
MNQTDLRRRAEAAMPGGVNSPVRAFRSVGGEPLFARRGEGAWLETTDGRRRIDFCMSFGPLILGHAHPEVVAAVAAAAVRGTSFAVTTEAEIELAELIQSAMPGLERLRLVSSGTEAAMTAVRLARGFTGRSKILKFSGCYHGHSDGLLVKAGSGVAGIAEASSDGVPAAIAGQTLVAPYNDFEAVTRLAARHARQLAAIMVEPVAGNMGLVHPEAGYLEHLREVAQAAGALLIFDEVITGFRLSFGGYQETCGIRADLTCLGKIIGGGMPMGAVGGRADIMEKLAPLGPVYQAGTLSGNPISVAAGLATLRHLKNHNPYPALEQKTEALARGIEEAAGRAGVEVQVPRLGSMFSVFFRDRPVRSFADCAACDADRFKRLFHALLERGVYLPPSAFETSFLSIAHDDAALAAARDAFASALADA